MHKVFKNIKKKRNPRISSKNSCEEEVSFLESLASHHPSPLSILIEEERFTKVQEALGKLKEKEKNVIRSIYLLEERYYNVAEITKTPIGTVKSRTYNTLKKLRGKLSRTD